MIEYVKMKREHIDGLVVVEEQCFNSGFARKTFEKELENKIAEYIVAVCDGMILGYAGLWNICGTADIIDVAVHKDFRRQGIAQKMMEKLIDICKEKEISEINLEVRESNFAAQSLYSGLGFEKCGERANYYKDRETAILMKKEIKEKSDEDTCD